MKSSSLLKRTRNSLIALFLLPATCAISQAAVWTYEWDATSTTPASAGWTLTGTNPNSPIPAGLLIPATAYYTQAFDGDASTGWTLELLVRRSDTNAGLGTLLYIADGTRQTEFYYYGTDRYRVNAASYVYPYAPGNDNTVFQSIHITRKDDSLRIYFNGNDTPDLTYTVASASASQLIRLGDFASGNPASVVQSVKWSTEGAYSPSQIPEPAHLALLVIGFGCMALARRKP